jgi:hypothetical protein
MNSKLTVAGVVVMTLAVAGFLPAQEEGWKFGGELFTGLRLDFGSGGNDWKNAPDYVYENVTDGWVLTDREGVTPWDPVLSVHHDDQGNRLRFEMLYRKDNYGIVFGGGPGFDKRDLNWEMKNLYGWFEMDGGMSRVEIGKIDNPIWSAPVQWELNYSTGVGLRFIRKPVQTISYGFFLRPAVAWGEFWDQADTSEISPYYDKGGDARNLLFDSLMETSFGFYWENWPFFVMAAGLKLSSRQTNAKVQAIPPEEWELPPDKWMVQNSLNARFGEKDMYDYLSKSGQLAYLSFAFVGVPHLWATIGAELNNFLVFNEYGYVWIKQLVNFNYTTDLSFGIWAQQWVFGKDVTWNDIPWWVGPPGSVTIDTVPFTIGPFVEYRLNGRTRFKTEVKIWHLEGMVDYLFEIMPSLSFHLGSNFYLYLNSNFRIAQFSEKTGWFFDVQSDGTHKNRPSDIYNRNTIQLNLQYSFL